jgi:hypothetical protein
MSWELILQLAVLAGLLLLVATVALGLWEYISTLNHKRRLELMLYQERRANRKASAELGKPDA